MNLGEIRNAIFSQSDWAPTQSADAVSRVNNFINRAYFQLSQEAPFLFFEDEVHLTTQPDVEPGIETDKLAVIATDPWCLIQELPYTTLGLSQWDDSGAWNGRMIRVTDGSGRVHKHRIRSVFTKLGYAGPAGVGNYRLISLYKPWHNITDTGLTWRIYTPDYYLPDDVIEVNSVCLAEADQNWPLNVLGQLEAEKFSLQDDPSQVASGVPRTIYRRSHHQIESPTVPPKILPEGEGGGKLPWQGPDPAGQFEYCFTYCWGYRDNEQQNYGPPGSLAANQGPNARLEPLWESAPSPVASASTTNAVATAPGVNGALKIVTPNIDFMQGFGRVADTRYQQSGWRKRIYRRRITVDTVLYSSPPLTQIEPGAEEQGTPDTMFLLFDIPGHQIDTMDNGTIIPDFHRRLRDVHGYQSMAMYPRPDKRYDVDIRCIRRPSELRDDNDVPRIHRDTVDVLIHRALAYLYEAQGNTPLADRILARYMADLVTMTKRYGDLRYPAEPLKRKPARASDQLNSRKPFRRWYNLPTS